MARPGLTQHRKFLRLARALDDEALALGSLEFLWLGAYESGDPTLGTPADVELVSRWRGAPGKLFAALLDAGFVEPEESGADGVYQVHDLYDHAPDYVQRRMEREAARTARGETLSDVRRRASLARKCVQQAIANDRQLLSTNSTQKQLTDTCNRPSANVTTPAPAPAPAPKEKEGEKKCTQQLDATDGHLHLVAETPAAPKPKRARRPKPPTPNAPPLRFSIADLTAALKSTGGCIVSPYPSELSARLTDVIRALPADVSPPDIARVSRWLAAGGDGYCTGYRGQPADLRAVALGSTLASWVGQARAWQGGPVARKPNGSSGAARDVAPQPPDSEELLRQREDRFRRDGETT